MTSCTIIISHFESLPFLHACVRQIRRYGNENVAYKTLIIDQSNKETNSELSKIYAHSDDVFIINIPPLYSGYGIDWAMRYAYINTDYICQLHVDAFPIHKNWLYLPIKLIEENNFSFVGQLQCICDGTQSIYPPTPFFAMAQCFNVARTETYREMSLEAGFTRFHNRRESGLTFNNNDWATWASEDYNARGSDDDVVAFSWQDRHRQHDKLGLAVSGFIEPSFGRVIDEIVFHFGSANESIGVIDNMSEKYQYYTKKINEDYSDELIEEMLALVKSNKSGAQILNRNYWNGKLKVSNPPSDELNKRIEELKHE